MKKIKILTITLLIILITMIAFFGIYGQVQNRMENKVKDYSYAMDINGSRVVRLKVNTNTKEVIKDKDGNVVESATDEEIEKNGYQKEEVPVNSQENLNQNNYKNARDIIEKRLKKLNVENYIVKLNEETGDIVIEISEDDNTDSVLSDIDTVGKFEIIDSETKEVLLNNDDIKLSNVVYYPSTSGTSVYLNIEFDKDGAKKLEDISNKYVKTEENNADENSNEQNEEQTSQEKKITMKIDDQEIMSTSFDEPIKNGTIQLTVGSASTDKTTIKEYAQKATTMATLLDTGKLPISYTTDENKYVLSDITSNTLLTIKIVIAACITIALIILIVKYKSKGFLGAISYVGLVSILLLTIRYANVTLSIEGIYAVVLTLILNYILTIKLLSNRNKTIGQFFIEIIPVCILSIVFCFIKWIPISSFGMVMFWGLVIMAIYNIIVTKNMLKLSENK
jgi:preprotein translocase subunit SecD